MATKDTLNQKFSEICRLCLKQDGVMASIFLTVDPEDGEFSLAQRISTIARVQINEDDGLPSLICHMCRHQVEKSYNFRLLVEISDRTLRNCLESAPADETGEEETATKQERSEKNVESTDDENMDLEQFLLENNLADSDVDPSSINVIFVRTEDGTQVLNICSTDDAQEAQENLETQLNLKTEYASEAKRSDDPIARDASEKEESGSELDDLEGIRQLLRSEKIYVEDLEPEIQTVYPCSECEEMFLTDDQLNEHISAEHGEEDKDDADAYGTDLSCQLCSEAFDTLSELKNHVAEHFLERRNLGSIESDRDGDGIVELDDTVRDVLENDCRYVLEVSKEDENCSDRVSESNLTEEIAEDGEGDILVGIEEKAGENSPKGKFEKLDSVDVELDSEVDNDVEYKADVYYCVKEYLSDRTKPRPIGNYPCTQCEKTFTQKHEQTLHLRRHLGIKPFKCTFCDKAFITNALRKEHERAHTGDKAFVCVVCGKGFVKKSELKYHEGIHTDTPSNCNICNKEFTNVQSFKMHTKRHVLGSRYVCETCGKSYYTNSELARHLQMHSGKREYPCHLCQTSFLSRPELNRHLKYHIGEKKFQCKICFKSYFESGHLKIHERVHTGEKPYVCTICKKAFVTKPKLVRHEKIHTKELIANCGISADQPQDEPVIVKQ